MLGEEKRRNGEMQCHAFTIRVTVTDSFEAGKLLVDDITQGIKETPGIEYAVNVYQGSYWRNITPRDHVPVDEG